MGLLTKAKNSALDAQTKSDNADVSDQNKSKSDAINKNDVPKSAVAQSSKKEDAPPTTDKKKTAPRAVDNTILDDEEQEKNTAKDSKRSHENVATTSSKSKSAQDVVEGSPALPTIAIIPTNSGDKQTMDILSAVRGEAAVANVEDTSSKDTIKLKDEIAPKFFDYAHFKLALQPGAGIFTIYDQVYDFILEKKKTTIDQIAKATNTTKFFVDDACRILAEGGLCRIEYPMLFMTSATVYAIPIAKSISKEIVMTGDKRLIEEYVVIADFVESNIRVWSVPAENTPIYEIVPHPLGVATQAVLAYTIDELSAQIPVSVDDVTDPEKIEATKEAIFLSAKKIIKQYLPAISDEYLLSLSGYLLHLSFGLGDLEVIMADNWLEEVAINGDSEPLSLYHRRYGWLKTTKFFDKQGQIYDLSSQIARKVGKQINSLAPIMDAHLQTGDRVAATLFPISTEGDTITIRRFSRNPWTIVHMVDEKIHTMSKEIMAFLWLAMQYEMNFLVVGGTASGKTSVLNTLCSLINPTNRIISIEDTRELSLPSQLHWNWVPMQSKSANTEGQGEISMLDLIVASLRMRPDRIIVGEIRRKPQAEALFEAMHTGHAVCGTMHADTAEQIKHRLTQPPMDIPENELEALQLVVVQYRDRRRGVRRTLEVAEVLPGGSDAKINLNYLYRWRPRSDTFAAEDPSIRVIEDLNLHTGMTQTEIENDLSNKEKVLDWLLTNHVMDVDKVGHVMRVYYKSPQLLLDLIRDNVSPQDFFSK